MPARASMSSCCIVMARSPVAPSPDGIGRSQPCQRPSTPRGYADAPSGDKSSAVKILSSSVAAVSALPPGGARGGFARWGAARGWRLQISIWSFRGYAGRTVDFDLDHCNRLTLVSTLHKVRCLLSSPTTACPPGSKAALALALKPNARLSPASPPQRASTVIAEFTEVESGKGSDALARRPQLRAA